jgi:hypothetical protein
MTATDVGLSKLLAVLAESALAVERLAAEERGRARHASGRAARVIELRLKLEEQVLLPALRALNLSPVAVVECQIEILRDLLAEADDADLSLAQQRELWGTILRACEQHFDAVAGLALLALQSGRFDEAHALREVRAYQARWRQEIEQTGDIEDEEADPVGQPPR